MDTAILIFCIVGGIMFVGYLFLIYWTSYKDYSKKKKEE